MQLDPKIFRAYDIRGVVGQDFGLEGVTVLGQAIGTMVRRQNISTQRDVPHIVVGFDGRLSSPDLEEALVAGLKATGANVSRIGCGPTPMTYFASQHLAADGAVMITGSHNPPDYNGFKIVMNQEALFGDQIQALLHMIEAQDFHDGSGIDTRVDVMNDYVQTLVTDFKDHYGDVDVRVAWDPGHGAAAELVQDILSQISGEHFLINGEIDGTFPAHHPDPTVSENLEQLVDIVDAMDCDYGLAFDGDGDRIGVVDRQGRMVCGDELMILYASEVLTSHPGATIVADVKTSQSFFDAVAQKGGKPLMWKTGHSFIKKKMKDINSPLGGEMSGHIFFADRYFGFDDGLYAALRLIGILSKMRISLAEWIDQQPDLVGTHEIKMPFDHQDMDKFGFIVALQDVLRQESVSFSDIDGVRVSSDKGWWLVRASNTEDHIMARAEAYSEKDLDLLLDDMELYLKKAGFKEAL